jgi:diguanylate cyclase (GGDEF)-like protein/PAS domain S-box-containing protein
MQYEHENLAWRILESTGDATLAVDVNWNIIYANPAAERLLRVRLTELIHANLSEVVTLQDTVTREPVTASLAQYVSEEGLPLVHSPMLLQRPDGSELPVQLASAMLQAHADIFGLVITLREFGQTYGRLCDLEYQATHDSLTGLINRQEFERRLKQVSKMRRSGDEHVLLFMDLDNFKVVNDTCGHAVGDKVLKQVAQRLQSAVRQSDTLARLGGDEFALLLTQCPMPAAMKTIRALRHSLDAYNFRWRSHHFNIGISIGMVTIGPSGGHYETILTAADQACYTAKSKGRNTVHVSAF